jgi:predicted lipase
MTPTLSDRELARLCIRAYTEQTWRAAGDVEVLLDTVAQAHCLAFRGTEFDGFSPIDLIRDLRFLPWYDGRVGWCHAGFLKGAQAIWPLVEPVAMKPGYPVALTGHSLGGALACIVAGFMCAGGKPPARLVTFGCPKPAYSGLRMLLFRHLNGNQKHYVNDGDPVPRVPPFGDAPMPQFLAGGEGHRMSDYAAALT